MDKLYMISGPLMGATAELIGEEITIGRASDNTICIDDESVSDHHAVITRKNRGCVVRDLRSAKGTFVRGDKVIIAALQDGDRVAFGSVEAQFETTEIKLQMPTTPVVPTASQNITWPQRGVFRGSPAGSSFKSAALTLMTLVALLLLAGGGYVVYQKFSNMDPTGDAPATESAKVIPLAAASRAPVQPPHYTAAAALPPTPQPYAMVAPAMPQPAAPVAPAAPQPATAVPVKPSSGVAMQSVPNALTATPQPAAISSAYNQLAMKPRGQTLTTIPIPAASPVLGAVPGAPSSETAPEPRANVPAMQSSSTVPPAAKPLPDAVVVDIRTLKPKDWVRGLPVETQNTYFAIRVSLRGNERVEAFRSWLSLWKQYLRDPNLTLVELDYIKTCIENRDSLLYERISLTSNAQWAKMEAAIKLRLTVLDSLENMLRATRVRGTKYPDLLEMIGEYTEKIGKERIDLIGKLSSRGR